MKQAPTLTRETLMAALSYDNATGGFTWVKNGKRAGCRRKDGYIVVRINDVLHYAHRLALLYTNDQDIPAGRHVDHINGNPSDNRVENLRVVSASMNSQNTRKLCKNTRSGLLGVQKNHNGWQAVINLEGKRYCLGTFKTPEDAHTKYIATKRVMHAACTV